MTVVIDPVFSVYRLTQRDTDYSLLRHRRTMSVVSYEIENATLLDGAENVIFSSFQRMSKFLPQVDRYTRIAARADQVWVFGIPDVAVPPIPNVTYVPLEAKDQLAKEWFLVSYGPGYASALATEELTHIDDPDDMRQFRGIWTFDRRLVNVLYGWLTRIVEADTYNIDQAEFNETTHLTRMANTITRMETLTGDDRLIQMESSLIAGEIRETLIHEVQAVYTRMMADE
ncbi:MAG: DICT sensory domain-containing protein [Anaerolineae bacterium]